MQKEKKHFFERPVFASILCIVVIFFIILVATFGDSWMAQDIPAQTGGEGIAFEYRDARYVSVPDAEWMTPDDYEMIGHLEGTPYDLYKSAEDHDFIYMTGMDAEGRTVVFAREGHSVPPLSADPHAVMKVSNVDATEKSLPPSERYLNGLAYRMELEPEPIQAVMDAYHNGTKVDASAYAPGELMNRAIMMVELWRYRNRNDLFSWGAPLFRAVMYVCEADGNYYLGLQKSGGNVDFVEMPKALAQTLWDGMEWGDGHPGLPMP